MLKRLLLGAVFLVIVAVGAVLVDRSRRSRQRETQTGPTPEELLEAVAASEAAGAGDAAAVATEGDDFRIIEGIGPRIDGVLKGAGIQTFADLAELRSGRIETILREAGTRMANPETWPEQARLAAEGKLEELVAFQATLKGGRRTA